MVQQAQGVRRLPLSRDRVLRAAVALADAAGIEALSMRKLSHELGVVPMALYKHVANKDELLGGMVDVLVGEIDPADPDADWKSAVRQRILSARRVLLRHPWASRVIESRTSPTPEVMDYMDSMIAMFRAGGFSDDLAHHVMHALGSRMFGFTQELFTDSSSQSLDPEMHAAMMQQLAGRWPNIVAIATGVAHDEDSVVGPGCDDQFEFAFSLDLALDGFDQLRQQGWSSKDKRNPSTAVG